VWATRTEISIRRGVENADDVNAAEVHSKDVAGTRTSHACRPGSPCRQRLLASRATTVSEWPLSGRQDVLCPPSKITGAR
jgi:hypothetical protein